MSVKIMKYRGKRYYLYNPPTQPYKSFAKAKKVADHFKNTNGCKYQIDKLAEGEFDLWLTKKISFQ